jgi:seryl-tRNA synthetase
VIISYARLAAAEAHYQAAGFELVEAPWIIGHTAYRATKPAEALDFVTLGGYLVASAEQSFLQLMLEGRPPGRAVATTPCFRHEHYDELHQPYFMKVELIDTLDTSEASLQRMIATAQGFSGAT